MHHVEIVELTCVNDEVVEAFARLIPQLSDAAPPDKEKLEAIIASPGTTVYLAADPTQNGKIVGTLTLVVYRTPTAVHAWIEDVVVDAAYRNQGIGEMLTRAAIERAGSEGAKFVDLTSRPQRVAANRLYQKMGFQLRSTNLYRLKLGDS